MKLLPIYILLALSVLCLTPVAYAGSDLLTSEENVWLSSRNNTLSVIPERNNPPFSFNDSSYISQGIFIDYIKLVAEKLNVRVDYVTARSRADIIKTLTEDKGDSISTLEVDKAQELSLLYNAPYSTFPVVIAVRKDYDAKDGMTFDDFNNKNVAVLQGSAISTYIKANYPRVIIDEVVDNELALQKVALNEVDATVMNSASLTHLLSKQSMRSIKVVGSLTFDLKMAFVVPKDKEILNSILAKGLKQISAREHQAIIDKWIILPNERGSKDSFFSQLNENFSTILIIVLSLVIIFLFIFFRKRALSLPYIYPRRTNKIDVLEEEIAQLEHSSASLIEELKDIKNLETDIKEKIKEIEK